MKGGYWFVRPKYDKELENAINNDRQRAHRRNQEEEDGVEKQCSSRVQSRSNFPLISTAHSRLETTEVDMPRNSHPHMPESTLLPLPVGYGNESCRYGSLYDDSYATYFSSAKSGLHEQQYYAKPATAVVRRQGHPCTGGYYSHAWERSKAVLPPVSYVSDDPHRNGKQSDDCYRSRNWHNDSYPVDDPRPNPPLYVERYDRDQRPSTSHPTFSAQESGQLVLQSGDSGGIHPPQPDRRRDIRPTTHRPTRPSPRIPAVKGCPQLPKDSKEKLKAWLILHLDHPYPNETEKKELAGQARLKKRQVRDLII